LIANQNSVINLPIVAQFIRVARVRLRIKHNQAREGAQTTIATGVDKAAREGSSI
jgi:hypothetical protein